MVVALLKYLVLPSSIILLSVLLGTILTCLRASRKYGIALLVFALSVYVVFASGPVSFLLLGHLEYEIPPATASERLGSEKIVVLTAYAESNQDIPLSAWINTASAFRVLEVIGLVRTFPEATVILSGQEDVPRIMRDVLVASGIPSHNILIDDLSSNTVESAKHISPILRGMPFLLVTSAGHMPRAFGVFRKAGMNPRPVPTHYLSKRNWLAVQFLPSPMHLVYSDLAVSEYLALFWYRWRGWI